MSPGKSGKNGLETEGSALIWCGTQGSQAGDWLRGQQAENAVQRSRHPSSASSASAGLNWLKVAWRWSGGMRSPSSWRVGLSSCTTLHLPFARTVERPRDAGRFVGW